MSHNFNLDHVFRKVSGSENVSTDLNSIQVDSTQLEIFVSVGTGNFSDVFKGKIFGIEVAVKQFKTGKHKVRGPVSLYITLVEIKIVRIHT